MRKGAWAVLSLLLAVGASAQMTPGILLRPGVIERGTYFEQLSERAAKKDDASLKEAASVCSRAAFDDQKACLARVEAARRFDRGAVAVCRGLDLPRHLAACFAAAADKDYAPAETGACASQTFDGGRIGCLAAAGRRRDA